MWEIGKQLGFDSTLTNDVFYYLKGEYLVVPYAMGGRIRITHQGIIEVEEALSNPEQPTEHFLPYNLIIVGRDMISSQIQQSSPSAVQQMIIDESRYDELKIIIQELKESIDEFKLEQQSKTEFQTDIQTIEVQLTSPRPKTSIISECLGSIRRILEGAAGSVLAQAFLSKIGALVGGG